MSLEQTPSKEMQFVMEEDESSPQDTPSTQPMSSQELCDSFVVADDASIEYEKPKKEKKEIDLEACAAKDEALWPDEHTSDEEEYNDNKENKEESTEDESDDEPCDHHDKCVAASHDLFDFLLQQGFVLDGKKREAKVALAEAVCDHFKRA